LSRFLRYLSGAIRSPCSSPLENGAVGPDALVLGTYLHGLFDSASGLEALLGHLRRLHGKEDFPRAAFDPMAERERRYDGLADHFRRTLRIDSVGRLPDSDR